VKSFSLAAFEPPLTLPTLDCDLAMLRPFDHRDIALARQASRDPHIVAISSLPPESSVAEAEAFIARQHERACGGHGYSLVIAPSTEPDRGVGSIGLWLRDIEHGRATIGYWVVASARGGGLAGSALRGLVAFAFSEMAVPRLQLYIEPWNVASVRTAQSAGFSWEANLRGWARIDGEQHDADCYSLLRDEWVPS
jgi:ribosomal-protein-alanine N-acetyltransferase